MLGPKEQAVEALRSGDPEQALDLLREAAQADPRDPQIYGLAGVAYGQLRHYDQAVAALEHAVGLDPESASHQYNLARALEKVGRTTESGEAYERTLVLAPGHQGAREALARLGRSTPVPQGAEPVTPQFLEKSFSSASSSPADTAAPPDARGTGTGPSDAGSSRHTAWLWAFGIATTILLVLVILLSAALEKANRRTSTPASAAPAAAA